LNDGVLPQVALPPIAESRDLGFMLYDMDFSDPANTQPCFYRAKMENGIIEVPVWGSEEVLR
jgi:CRISPR-associated protein Cas5d